MSVQHAKLLKQVAVDLPENAHGYIRKDGTVMTYTSMSLPFELKTAFKKACYKHGLNASQQLKLMMQDFVNQIKEK